MPRTLLEAKGIMKRFGSVEALHSVDFAVQAGEVVGLLGENGAGKSTLIKILCGVLQPDDGTLVMEGKPVRFPNPRSAIRAGIRSVHQELSLFPHMSVLENVLAEEWSGPLRLWSGRQNRAAAVEDMLMRLGMNSPNGSVRVEQLHLAEQQLVEIARVLLAGARVLILDEPTSALSAQSAENLMRACREMASRGLGVVFVSHRMGEVMEVCDHVVILRNGGVVASIPRSEMEVSRVVEAMTGRHLSVPTKVSSVRGDVVVSASKITAEPHFRNITFRVRQGEIVAFCGVLGSGATELAQSLFGLRRLDKGRLTFLGQEVALRSPRDAIRRGIAMVPASRREEGIFPDLSVVENAAIASWVKTRSDRRYACLCGELDPFLDWLRQLSVRMAGPHQPIRSLSGGNQQKVILTRWLATRPRLLIMVEPTRGVDIATRFEVYGLVSAAAQSGCAIIYVSSDFEEVAAVADTAHVLRNGEEVAVIEQRDSLTVENLLQAAIGGDE